MILEKRKRVYLGFGGNMGDTKTIILQAIDTIKQIQGLSFSALSSFWYTEPQGNKNQEWYVNCVLCLYCIDMTPFELLDKINEVEYLFGRERNPQEQNAARTLDIDILDFNAELYTTERLILPHPRMGQRAFVLVPLQEIEPDYILRMPDKDWHIADMLQKISYSLEGNKIYQNE